MSYADLPQRFRDKVTVDAESGCHVWTAAKSSNGYGRHRHDGRLQCAHRVAYEAEFGPIPAGMHLDHLCRNRACIRPDHSEPVTSRENTLRGDGHTARNARKTRCPRGHELAGENLTRAELARGRRKCLTCHRERAALRNALASALGRSWGIPVRTARRDERVQRIVRNAWNWQPANEAEAAEMADTIRRVERIERGQRPCSLRKLAVYRPPVAV